MTDLRLEPAACLRVNGRGKEDLDPVLLLNQPQYSLVHLQLHLWRTYEKDQLRPRGPQRRANSEADVYTAEAKKLGHLWPDQKGRLGKWVKKDPIIIRRKVRNMLVTPRLQEEGASAGAEEGYEETCNDFQSLFELAHRTTRPGNKGVCSLPRDMASEMTAPRNS